MYSLVSVEMPPGSRFGPQVRDAIREPLHRFLVTPALAAICGSLRVRGIERIARLDGPCIFIANHASHLDTPVIRAALPEQIRRNLAVAAASDSFFERPVVGPLVSVLFGAFPIRRHALGLGALRACLVRLEQGRSILIYPEGTRRLGGRGPFKGGATWVARHSGAPVVPVFVQGTDEALPRGSRFPRRARVAVEFGEAFRLPANTRQDEAERRVAEAFAALRRKQQSTAPPVEKAA